MRSQIRLFLTFILAAGLSGSGMAVPLLQNKARTTARLVLATETAKAGDTVLAGVLLRMPPEWHTYWRNSGSSGYATTIEWTLPAGVTAHEIQWPVPEKFTAQGEVTYVYSGESVLLVRLTLSPDLKPGPLQLKASVGWLECLGICITGDAEVSGTLNVGSETKPSADAELIEKYERKLPKPGDSLSAQIQWEKADGNSRGLIIEWTAPSAAGAPDFFPYESNGFEVEGATEKLASDSGKVRIRKMVKRMSGDWPAKISGLIVHGEGNERVGYEVTLSAAGDAKSGAAPAPGTPAKRAVRSLWIMLFYAVVGGLILNVMPCVLPVIALKILGFVNEAQSNPRRVRALGLMYTAGVLVSFLVMAGILIGIKAAGQQAGWGIQFSNPQFVVVLTILVTLVALNLFGLFEVNLSGRAMGAAGAAATKHGISGAFFNGVLATILATPCTAPFMGVALGFAVVQSAPVIALIFFAVGFGLALPYLLLSWHPAWLRFLPKPGIWMEKFKIAMGFPMLGTAVWLFSLSSSHYGKRSWWLAMFLVFVGIAAWIFGDFIQRGTRRRFLAAVIAIAMLAIGYAWALEDRLHWRQPIQETSESTWSHEAVAQARQAGHPVIVDFTADWCLTCNAVVGPALETTSVRQKLKETDAILLVADYTHHPRVITEELTRFERAGVPMVLVYPKDVNQAPIVLPEPSPFQLPSSYAKTVNEALDEVTRAK